MDSNNQYTSEVSEAQVETSTDDASLRGGDGSLPSNQAPDDVGSSTPPAETQARGFSEAQIRLLQANQKARAAVKAALRGWKVFPAYEATAEGACACGNTKCGSPGKHPRIKGWRERATDDPLIVGEWWCKWPKANIGLATGESGIVAIDIDPRNGGADTWAKIVEEHGPELEETTTSETPSGGFHFVYRALYDATIRGGSGRLGPGVDVKADGGFVVLPPSTHVAGVYKWKRGFGPKNRPPAPLPDALLKMLTDGNADSQLPLKQRGEPPAPRSEAEVTSAYGRKALTAEAGRVRSAPEGLRNTTLNDAAYRTGQLVGGGEIREDDQQDALTNAGQEAGLPYDETVRTLASGSMAGQNNPRQPGTNEPPQPLVRQVPSAKPYPLDTLGPVLAATARAIQEQVQAPIEICAQSVLAAATFAVQGHGVVHLPTGGIRPLSEFYVTIAETGERKTTTDDIAVEAVGDRELQLEALYLDELRAYEDELEAWRKQRAQILNDKKYPNKDMKSKALRAIGPKPLPPLKPMLTCPEPTFEGLVKLLREGQPSIAVFATEGGQFVGGYSMNADNRLKTAAGLSSLWDGSDVKWVRQGEGNFTLRGRRVALHLQMQPGVSAELFNDPVLNDQGITTRILAVMPNPAAGTRFYRQPSSASFSDISNFSSRMADILGTDLPLARNKRNELDPPVLRFSQDAAQRYLAFINEVEAEVGPGGSFEAIKGFANKAPEHAARIAGVLTLFDKLGAREIADGTMEGAIELVRYYLGERLRIQSASQVNTDLLLAQRLLSWLQNDWAKQEPDGLVSLPDIYQRGPNPIRDRATAEKIVGILVEHEWLEPVGAAKVAGIRRTKVWRIRKAPC